MKQQISIVYLAEMLPLDQICMSSDKQDVIGQRYCNNHKIIVLDNSEEEIKILLAKENVFCIDELSKVLPKGKRINAMLVEQEQILRLLTRIYDYEYPAEYPVLWTGMNAERGQGGCNPPHCLSRCPAL